MAGLRVLITNVTLAERSGTVLYVRDLAQQLLARGHTPIVYSRRLGEMAQQLRETTIPVVDDLDAVGTPPDVIHGHHNLETMTALLHFPGVPAIYVSHDFWHDWDEPPRFPRIRRYVAVDESCRDRLVCERGIPAERVETRTNFVDLTRFRPRPPLPERPRRALLFSNYSEENAFVTAIREACARVELELDVLGQRFGNDVARPEKVLGLYDIVLSKGRSALEALCVGNAVVLYSLWNVGPLVTAAEVDRLLPLNLGIRAMTPPVSPQEIGRRLEVEFRRFDAKDAAEASRLARRAADAVRAVDGLLTLYREAIAEQAADPSDPEAEGRAAAAYLRGLRITPRPIYAPFIEDLIEPPASS